MLNFPHKYQNQYGNLDLMQKIFRQWSLNQYILTVLALNLCLNLEIKTIQAKYNYLMQLAKEFNPIITIVYCIADRLLHNVNVISQQVTQNNRLPMEHA